MVRNMGNGTFYNKDCSEISKEGFIQRYNDSYFLGNERIVKNVRQSSKKVEDVIESILYNGISCKKDVIKILAWKIGKIKHHDTDNNITNNYRFVYAKGWENVSLKLEEFAQYIASNRKELEKEANENPQEALNKLKDKAPSGIGTVYLITILYFISRGKLPIYDKYARLAVYAIKNGTRPGEYIGYKELPAKNSNGFSQVYCTYKEYINDLKDIFGCEYKKHRDIDRALWVYGHSFSNDNPNCG